MIQDKMITDLEKSIFDFKRIYIVLSDICNAKCIMCNINHSASQRSSLTYENALQVGLFGVENGAKVIDLAGGEPFFFPHIDKLIEKLGKYKSTLNIITNGIAISKKHFKPIAEAKNIKIQFSVHGLGEVENSIKRNDKAFDSVNRNIQEVAKLGVEISLATVIQKRNLMQLFDIYRHFSSIPYTHHNFVLYEPINPDKAQLYINPEDVRIPSENLDEFYIQTKRIIQAAREDKKVTNLNSNLVNKYASRIAKRTSKQEAGKNYEERIREDNTADSYNKRGAAKIEIPTLQEKQFIHPGLLCTIPSRSLVVHSNGDVVPCVHFDWKALFPENNINNKSISELVYSRKYFKMIIKAISPGGCPGCSAGCYQWDSTFLRKITQPTAEDKVLSIVSNYSSERISKLTYLLESKTSELDFYKKEIQMHQNRKVIKLVRKIEPFIKRLKLPHF
jgi:radical SAM protein with 4Fe4S-binding SPASM domain